MKQTIGVGIVALALVGTVFGIATAQQSSAQSAPVVAQPEPSPSPGPNRADKARDGRDRFLAALAQKLGVSTDRLKQAFAEARQELGLPNRPKGPHGARFGGLEAAARAMNIGVDQLRQDLQGKSLTEVARAQNVDPATVASALKADASARIDQVARDGKFLPHQAAQMKQRANERIDQLMTRQFPAAGYHQRGRGPSA
jgi:hypothetical protein